MIQTSPVNSAMITKLPFSSLDTFRIGTNETFFVVAFRRIASFDSLELSAFLSLTLSSLCSEVMQLRLAKSKSSSCFLMSQRPKYCSKTILASCQLPDLGLYSYQLQPIRCCCDKLSCNISAMLVSLTQVVFVNISHTIGTEVYFA